MIGRNVDVLVPPEHQAHHDALIDHHRRTGEDRIVGTSREVQMERRDGTRLWVDLALSKIAVGNKTHYSAFVRDVTAERQQRQMIEQTLEQALDAVVTIDEHNEVIFFNAAAEALWGYDRDEVLGRNVAMLVPAAHQAHHDNYVNRNRRTGENRIVGTSREVEVIRKDGEQLWGLLSVSKVELGDRILYTAFLKDVTDEIRRRDETRMLSLVANETNNSVVITDANGRTEYVNRGVERLTRYSLEEMRDRAPGHVSRARTPTRRPSSASVAICARRNPSTTRYSITPSRVTPTGSRSPSRRSSAMTAGWSASSPSRRTSPRRRWPPWISPPAWT